MLAHSLLPTVTPSPRYSRTPGLGYSVRANTLKPKRTRFIPPTLTPKYLLLHQVECSRGGTHSSYNLDSYFLDVPRLFAGDSKATALRGEKEVKYVHEYLEDHPEISFAIYPPYDYNDYHESVKDEFHKLQIPQLDPAIISQLKPYFAILKSDCENVYESFVSEDLKSAICFTGFESPEDWTSPYLLIYHSQELMAGLISASSANVV